MGFTVTKTWSDGEVLFAADLNGNFTDVETEIDRTRLLMYHSLISTSATTEGDRDTFTFTAGDFDDGDIIEVVVAYNSGANQPFVKLGLSGGGLTTVATGGVTLTSFGTVRFLIFEDPKTTTDALNSYHVVDDTIATVALTEKITPNLASWIEKAFTIALRSWVSGGSHQFEWWVFRLKGT